MLQDFILTNASKRPLQVRSKCPPCSVYTTYSTNPRWLSLISVRPRGSNSRMIIANTHQTSASLYPRDCFDNGMPKKQASRLAKFGRSLESKGRWSFAMGASLDFEQFGYILTSVKCFQTSMIRLLINLQQMASSDSWVCSPQRRVKGTAYGQTFTDSNLLES